MTSTIATPAIGPPEPQQSLNAWNIAKARFLDGLDEGEKTLFKEATIENVFYKASVAEREDQKESKTRSLFQNFQPLISAIEDYGKALDTYSNIASLYIAPIWGSIRVVLVIASSHGRFYDRIVDTFGRIGDILPRFRDYQRIFNGEKHQRFTQKLSEAYLDIITLCGEFTKLLRQQKKSSMKRIFQPLSPALNAHLEEAVARFRQHRKAVDKEAEVCHMLEEKEARDLVHRNSEAAEAREREAKQEKLLSLLSKADYKYKHQRMQKIRHPGTGSWFITSPEFTNWLNCDSSAMMCCYGIPGCGKSVLISSLIDGLISSLIKPEVKHTIAFYYCDHADKRTLDPVSIFCCLARQCVGVLGGLPTSMLATLEEIFQEGKIPEIESLIELILHAIKRAPPLIIFIDGLDELNDRDRKLVFLKLTNLLAEAAPSTVKILITSREDTGYLTRVRDIKGFKVRIGASTIAEDIDSFVKHAIRDLIERRELVLGNPSLEDKISTALIQGAKGMFLWVKFQLADLCAADTDEAIANVLQNLPNDLGETYARLLGRIEGIKRREYVKRMFNWIISARRPLHVNELREAIAFTIEDREFDAKKVPNDMNRLVRACGNLLTIDEETEIIQLAHYTVEQYLLDTSKTWDFRVNRKEANYELGKFCVAYLSFSDFETQIMKFSDNVTPSLTALENVVGTQTLLNVPGGFVTKALTMLHNQHHSPTNIEFSRYIGMMKLPSKDGMAKYSILSYVTQNWLHHTTEFTNELDNGDSEDILAKRLFLELVFEKQLMFDFAPWKTPSNQQDKTYCFTLQLIWAISNNNITVLQGVLHRDKTPLGHYVLRASNWFFGARIQPSWEVSQEMLSRLKKHSFDDLPPPESWWGWLYAQLLHVAELGEIDIVNIVLDSLKVSTADWPDGGGFDFATLLLEHFIFEAGAHRQNDVAIAIWKLMKESRRFADKLRFTCEYDGIPCNVLERAAFAGSADIMDSLFANGYSISPDIRARALHNLRLQVACKEGDLALIRCLLKLANGPSSTRTLSPDKWSIDETAMSNPAAISYAVGCLLQGDPTYPEEETVVEGLHMAIDTLLALSTQPSLAAGMWLLYNAITENRCERVKSLIRAGAELSHNKIKHHKCFLFHDELLLHLRKKPYLAVEGLKEVSPLSWAIFNNRLEIVSLLLAAAISTEDKDPDLGYTALHIAVITGSLDCIELLHKYGACFTVEDLKGRNLEQFAEVACGSEQTKEDIIAAIKSRVHQP